MILVDPPRAEGHGRVWSHLASDTSYDELHAFARTIGIPERGFDGDHYDVPAEWYDDVVAAGATPVSSRELITRLTRAGLRRPKPRTLLPRPTGRTLLRPGRLRPGDHVAVVSPAGPTDPDRLSAGVAVLESWGLRVLVADPGRGDGTVAHPWLAGPDGARAAAITRAWGNPGVAAVWAARGGSGTQRVLDLLDWDALAGVGPRLLVGFSDVTALHQAVATRWGLATVHGPGVAGLGDGDPAAVEQVRRLVLDAGPLTLPATTLLPGHAEGPLVGGNLTVLAAGAGTPLVRPAEHGVALLEDVDEAPYRLDRSLTQLLRSGWFDGARAVVLGRFTRCGDPAVVRGLLRERLAPLGLPVVEGVAVGHEPDNHAVPLGLPAVVDAPDDAAPGGASVTFPRTLR